MRGTIDDMHALLARRETWDLIADVLVYIGGPLASRLRLGLLDARGPHRIAWKRFNREAAALAVGLEERAVTAASHFDAHVAMNAATMIRVLAGAPAGRPLEWKEHGSHWSATGTTGADWVIQRRSGGYAIYIATWDEPDWWLEDLAIARRFTDELDARPKFPESTWVSEQPVVVAPGDPYRPIRRQPPLPDDLQPCPECAAEEPPVVVKPAKLSPEWWTDPLPYWRCPACRLPRRDLPDVDFCG